MFTSSSGRPGLSAPIALFAVGLIVVACSGTPAASTPVGSPGAQPTPAAASPTNAPTDAPTATDPPASSDAPAVTDPPEPALTNDGNAYSIAWASVDGPFWAPAAAGSADPFFHIHTDPGRDGFFFSLEMYTTGYGALWTGELGDVAIICNEGSPGPNSTGICPHFDPDGVGPIGDLAADFAAKGSITINKLDATGYDIVVNGISFSNGATITSFQLTGP